MNRAEALNVLKTINTVRSSVNNDFCGTGFFFDDAVRAIGSIDSASRHIDALIKVGKIRCTTIALGFSSHDFYSVE